MLLVLWVIITVTFVLMHAIPGGPFTAEKALPEAVMKNIEARYRLNDPLPKQYVDYWANLMRGDLGPSFKYESRSVNEIIAEGFPVSAELGLVAVSLSVLIGIPAGGGALSKPLAGPSGDAIGNGRHLGPQFHPGHFVDFLFCPVATDITGRHVGGS